MRFEHILEKDEDVEYSTPVTINFNDVFHAFNVYEVRETTLAANQWFSEMKRFKFRSEPETNEMITDEASENRASITNPVNTVIPEPMMRPEISPSRQKRKRNKINRNGDVSASDGDDDYKISLKPMQIRTFVVTLEWKP